MRNLLMAVLTAGAVCTAFGQSAQPNQYVIETRATTEKTAPASPAKRQWSSSAKKQLETGKNAANATLPGEKDSNLLFRLLYGLAVMALLLGIFVFLLKKYGKKITGANDAKLKVVSRLQLDAKNALVLVKCYEDELLVGTGAAGGITLISKYKQIDVASDEENTGLFGDLLPRDAKEDDPDDRIAEDFLNREPSVSVKTPDPLPVPEPKISRKSNGNAPLRPEDLPDVLVELSDKAKLLGKLK